MSDCSARAAFKKDPVRHQLGGAMAAVSDRLAGAIPFNLEASVRSRGTEADGGRGRDLIEAGLSEAASRLGAMAKVSSSPPPLAGQDPGSGRAVVCVVLAAGALSASRRPQKEAASEHCS
jgi:hypothetical protein